MCAQLCVHYIRSSVHSLVHAVVWMMYVDDHMRVIRLKAGPVNLAACSVLPEMHGCQQGMAMGLVCIKACQRCTCHNVPGHVSVSMSGRVHLSPHVTQGGPVCQPGGQGGPRGVLSDAAITSLLYEYLAPPPSGFTRNQVLSG